MKFLSKIREYFRLIGTVIFTFLFSSSFVSDVENKYKCMLQLINYSGEGAYIVISIIDQKNDYKKTLKVLGDDEEWYPDISKWYPYYLKNSKEMDGITGATISGGERTIFSFDIDEKYFDGNHNLHIETAVEDQRYVADDLNFSLKKTSITGQHSGSGYIRYIKIIKI
tara:strand:- start:1753 stop:2256 length:504 start_codon:yes stop_codon:yes gene_type:complete